MKLSYHYNFVRYDFLVRYGNKNLFQQQEGEYQYVADI